MQISVILLMKVCEVEISYAKRRSIFRKGSNVLHVTSPPESRKVNKQQMEIGDRLQGYISHSTESAVPKMMGSMPF